jgi:hypothetical protein
LYGDICRISGGINNPPTYTYYNNFNSFIQNFSLIQVNLYFDAAVRNVEVGVATFQLQSYNNGDYGGTAVTKAYFMTNPGYQEPNLVTPSFIIQKGLNYTNNTTMLTLSLQSVKNNDGANTGILVGLSPNFKTFHWELIGLL